MQPNDHNDLKYDYNHKLLLKMVKANLITTLNMKCTFKDATDFKEQQCNNKTL